MKRVCWAREHSNCNGGISGEHLISKGIFKGKAVKVQGLPWSGPLPKTVGINALTANILCRDHNARMSPVDKEGAGLFHAIRRFEEILSGRMVPKTNEDCLHVANGLLLERWFLKTALNFLAYSPQGLKWHTGSPVSEPPVDLLGVVFGERRFLYPFGLSVNPGTKLGDNVLVGDQVGLRHHSTPDNEYVGTEFWFQSLNFMIWLNTRLEPTDQRFLEMWHHFGGQFQALPLVASLRIAWDAENAHPSLKGGAQA